MLLQRICIFCLWCEPSIRTHVTINRGKRYEKNGTKEVCRYFELHTDAYEWSLRGSTCSSRGGGHKDVCKILKGE